MVGKVRAKKRGVRCSTKRVSRVHGRKAQQVHGPKGRNAQTKRVSRVHGRNSQQVHVPQGQNAQTKRLSRVKTKKQKGGANIVEQAQKNLQKAEAALIKYNVNDKTNRKRLFHKNDKKLREIREKARLQLKSAIEILGKPDVGRSDLRWKCEQHPIKLNNVVKQAARNNAAEESQRVAEAKSEQTNSASQGEKVDQPQPQQQQQQSTTPTKQQTTTPNSSNNPNLNPTPTATTPTPNSSNNSNQTTNNNNNSKQPTKLKTTKEQE